MLSGLSQINVELTSRCDRHTLCGFCGHQDAAINKNVKGDIDFDLLAHIALQIPFNTVVQFHRDGEPTAYRRLWGALNLFRRYYITSIVTHGENLIKKADEIIGNCTSLTVSAFNGDPDMDLQVENVKSFLERKGDKPPMVNIKIVGFMSPERERVYGSLGVPIIRRLMHVPDGNYRYVKRSPTIPEHGICLDFLSHPSIDWRGNLYVCNRLDTEEKGLLGNLNDSTLDALWNGEKRLAWLEAHKIGRRDLAAPLCRTCVFYGVPSEA